MDRRQFFAFGGSALAAASAAVPIPALGESVEPQGAPAYFPPNEPIPTLEVYKAIVASLTGAKNPYPEEIARGRDLLHDIPEGATPYAVADEFRRWRKKKLKNKTPDQLAEYAYYAREWPIRGNPIIMGFFDATGLRNPQGDATYWCAAFVSWCIQRSAAVPGNAKAPWPYVNGASSGAFRNWGDDASNLPGGPRKGDLAVFKLGDSAYSGHVGFVDHIEPGIVWVLGGNQSAQDERNGGEVNVARFSTSPDSKKALKFHSYRRHSILGNAS